MEQDTRTFASPFDESQDVEKTFFKTPKILAERFRLIEVLGAGGSGTVWSAEDLVLEEMVAIKLLHKVDLDKGALARLKREVSTARSSHPNMVRIYDLHEAGGFQFLSMELVQGESLGAFLHREGTLDVERTIRIGAEMASALAHLHERGIIHRDVKPGNILMTPDGTAKLCDMGLARSMQAGMTVTATEMVVGTPAYMAPEQGTGRELGTASDVYALGLTLYRCLSGEVPNAGASPLSTLIRRQKERPPRLRPKSPQTPRWLSRLIRRMLEPDPRDRPRASVVCSALTGARFGFRPRRKTALFTAFLLLAACLTPLVYGHFRRGATTRFQVENTSVYGLDARGRRTWERSFDLPISSSLKADLDGDGLDEIVVATEATGGAHAIRDAQVEIEALGLNGDVLMAVRPRQIIKVWGFPYSLELEVALRAVDLDLDGRSELVVIARRRNFFPSALLLYSPKFSRWSVLMEHPGWIRQLQFLPNRVRPHIRFLGVRNRPLMVSVVGEIEIRSVGGSGESMFEAARITDGIRETPVAKLAWYTMLDPDLLFFSRQPERLRRDSNDGIVVVEPDSTEFHLDRWGNVLTDSKSRNDLHQERLEYLGAISRLGKSVGADAETVRAECSRIRERWPQLMQETAYRVGLDLVEAHALSHAEDRDAAMQILEASATTVRNEDLDYRLANLLAIKGRFNQAIASLEPMMNRPRTVRGDFDARVLLIRIAMEVGETDFLERALHDFRAGSENNRGQSEIAIRARIKLWWDRGTSTDCNLKPTIYEPAAEAIACLARWRQGHLKPEDPEKMHVGLEDTPDAFGEYLLAEAAADLGLGRPEEALKTLDSGLPKLQDDAVDDFSAFQLLQLGRALHARTLLDVGEVEQARSEARQLILSLTPEKLPAILTAEVLNQIESGNPK